MSFQVLVWAAALAASAVPYGALDASTSTGLPNANDAGSGGDAGDTPTTALELPEYGSYQGAQNSPKDADWYALHPPSASETPICVSATVSGDAFSDVTLTVDDGDGSVRSVAARTGDPTVTSVLAIASRAGASTSVGFVPVPNPSGGNPTRPGGYAFDIRAVTAAHAMTGDGGTGSDASSVLGTATPVDGGCVAGTLRAGDQQDVFSFRGYRSQVATLSLFDTVDSTARLSLIGPDGSTITSVPSRSMTAVALAEDGTYYLSVARSTSIPLSASAPPVEVPYAIGLGLDPKPPPCAPGC
ncbi:MAG TPA: hypothetical protein VI997_05875 [Candidatus Thermoplasmatota archaeon]|nr:hypothetical protein [Candidatus Thermoplasmatota archaeon]